MPSGSEGTKGGDSPAKSEGSDTAMPLLSPQDISGHALMGPGGSGAGADPGQSNPGFVTERVLAVSLGELEKRMAKRIAKAISGRKRTRSPSPEQEPSDTEILSLGELDRLDALDQGGSEIEDLDTEGSGSASQGESLWVQALTDMVHEAFKLPIPEPQVSAVSALGSLRTPQSNAVFPVHPLLEDVIFQGWIKPDSLFTT